MATREVQIAATAQMLRRSTSDDASDALDVLLDGYFWHDVAPGMTCTEADAFAVLLVNAGAEIDKVAEWVIEYHAPGDDEGDSHYVEGS